LPGHDSCK
jgi:hypothetical protein